MRFPIKITDNFILEPVMHMFGAGRDVSYAEIAGGKLTVKMGIWFDESFPLDQISAIAPSDWPWWGGLGVKLVHHGVGVVGSTEGIVNVKFKTPQKARVIVQIDCNQLFLSLEDAEGFMRQLAEASKLPVSAHTPF
jgi:hypothetical protein